MENDTLIGEVLEEFLRENIDAAASNDITEYIDQSACKQVSNFSQSVKPLTLPPESNLLETCSSVTDLLSAHLSLEVLAPSKFQQSLPSHMSTSQAPQPLPTIEITEQPANRYRFRYKSELRRRATSSIPGFSSTSQ